MIEFDIIVHRPTITVQGAGQLKKGITVLTGKSGSGKSTIIKSIAGLVHPDAGHIHRDGQVWYSEYEDIYIRPQGRQVGYMPQGNVVFPHLSVRSNIEYSRRGDENLFNKIVDELHLTKYLTMKAGNLSGGEQQRVALGRALYSQPCVLLLDEPLSALDLELREQVRRDLVTTIRDWNIPCLWVTHDKEEAETVGDYYWSCEAGKMTV